MLITTRKTGFSCTSLCRRDIFCGEVKRSGHGLCFNHGCFHTAVKRDPDSGIGLGPIKESHFNRSGRPAQLPEL